MKKMASLFLLVTLFVVSCEKKIEHSNIPIEKEVNLSKKEVTLSKSSPKNKTVEKSSYDSTKVQFEALPGVATPSPGSLDIVRMQEFLDFGCIHCRNFNLFFPELKRDFGNKLEVETHIMPWRGKNVQALYYVAEKKGVSQEAKDILFMFYHDSQIRNINDMEILFIVAKDLELANSPDELQELMDAPDIREKISVTDKLIAKYIVRSTPTVILQESMKVNWSKDYITNTIRHFLKG